MTFPEGGGAFHACLTLEQMKLLGAESRSPKLKPSQALDSGPLVLVTLEVSFWARCQFPFPRAVWEGGPVSKEI